MNPYYFQEGVIQVPTYLADGTVNLLIPIPGNLGLTIAISRDELAAGEKLESFADRQMAELAKQVGKFEKGRYEQAQLGVAPKSFKGLRFALSYKRQGRDTHHVQALFADSNSRKTLGFAFSSHAQISAEQHQKIDQILSSYKPH